jgi:uncharacterized protein (DUF983 family)
MLIMQNATLPATAQLAAATVHWPAAEPVPQATDLPPIFTMLKRGLRGRCPVCGKGKIFNGFLSVVDRCSECGTELGRIRADDAPPYFTIVIVGHVVILLMLWLERAETPPLWVHSAIFLPLTVGLALALIRPIKGATIGAMLKLGLITPSDTPRANA